MPRPRNKRPPSVKIFYSAYDRCWHGHLTVGVRPDGRPDRRQRTSPACGSCQANPRPGCECYERCADKIRELEDQVAADQVAAPGRRPTVERYLTDWLAGRRLRYKTMEDYTRVVRTQLVPHLGGYRIDALRPEHIKTMLAKVEGDLSPSAAHRAHRVLRSALSDAVREEVISRNPVKLVRAPQVPSKEIAPLTVKEVRAVLAEIQRLPRNRGRWLLALTIGMRQGECLALAHHRADPRLPGDLDLDAGTLTVREKLLRHAWQHGCPDPHDCAARHCRTGPCPPSYGHGCGDPAGCSKLAHRCPRRRPLPGCSRHRGKAGCPAPCRPDCTGHARACPDKVGGGLVKEPPKSAAGRRTIVLPAPVLTALRSDAQTQEVDRERAGELWQDSGMVFTGETGGPLDPRADYQQWRDLLAEAGVPPARLHDARHTAATFLLVLGVDERTVMDVMGWSQKSMLDRYQHVVDELRTEAAKRIEGLWWPAPEPGPDPGSATDHATADRPTAKRRHLRAV